MDFVQPRSELHKHADVPMKDPSIDTQKSALQDAGGMSSPWLQLLDCLCQWVWTHPPWWQPTSPMQFGSLPGMGRGVQVRGAVEPSPGGDARVSGRGGLGWGVGWEGDWGGGGRGRRMGYPGNRLPLCMGESSGEETPLTWRMCVWGCVLRREACNCTSVLVFVFVSYLLSWKFKQLQTLQLVKTWQYVICVSLKRSQFSSHLDAMQLHSQRC